MPAANLWPNFLSQCRDHLVAAPMVRAEGRLTRVAGLVMEAVGLRLPVGSTCLVSQEGASPVEAEVVGFAGNKLFLMPTSDVFGLMPGATVTPADSPHARPVPGRANHPWRRAEDRTKHLPVGDGLLGRVLDAQGRPLDALGPVETAAKAPLSSRPLNPIDRVPVSVPLDTGVRAINALTTVGRGQRMGLFAGSGVGKSVLLGMMARYTNADVTVVGLIGERGREVKEFIEDSLGADGLQRAVVIAAPADVPPLLRMQGAAYATTVAEHFRNRGKHVLLIMDSLTRYAMAQREIALAIGEPPATKGYPPSVFAKLPQLVERAGNGSARAGGGAGSITAFYTVLTEGDDQQDPIADAARAILDGHIVLSRSLADSGHYPAIDVEQSISRVMHAVTRPEELRRAKHFKTLVSRYQRNRDLINVGAYAAGSDPVLDQAIARWPQIEAFLQQDMREHAGYEQSLRHLASLIDPAA
ncbi:MAG: flagellar protein export ATPase FliI [Burkholderiales bacterium]|nr:flagellar protein export ATPase FliI [Burkholderiales bacterium]